MLGPNGAGKTTTVQILSTLINADGGNVRIFGHDLKREPDAVRRLIGVTGQFSAVDNLLTGRENLNLMADLCHLDRAAGRRRIADLLDQFDLADAAGKPVSTYSGGMRRRLDLAMTLVGAPRVIFLDEPTTGLDPRSRRSMWQIIRALAAEGVTILLTTQYLEEADQLADRVAFLDHGRLIAEGTRTSSSDSSRAVTSCCSWPTRRARLGGPYLPGRHPGRRGAHPPGAERWRGRVAAVPARPARPGLDQRGRTLRAHPDLDDVFLTLTGQPDGQAGRPDHERAPAR
ncbi:daunorubicin resistance protein DrrA family ABC transporter ATP-binding protein [Micromonospora vulcania]